MKKYVVKQGDTLYNISQKTGVRIPLLLASNPQIQNPSQLMPGMSMVIPELGKKAKTPGNTSGGANTAAVQSKAKAQPPMPPYFGFVWPHQVAPSETWDTLAQKYGVSVEQLHHLNPDLAASQTLQPGPIVYVPTPAYQIPAGQGGQMPGMQQMPGMSQMPGTPQMPQMPMYAEPSSQVPATEPTVGPHTHHPYRPQADRSTVAQGGYAAAKPGWYVKDESSSFLSDDDMRGGTASVPDTDDDGWSETFTVRFHDEE